jgi:hypothetical protein
MKPERELRLLRQRAKRRLLYLSGLSDTLSDPRDRTHDRAATFISLEISNLWQSFAREYYLSCAVRSALTSSGQPVKMSSAAFLDDEDALFFAIQKVAPMNLRYVRRGRRIPRRFEPNWADPATLVRLALFAGFSNHSTILSATSFATTVFRDLPTIRNFYAHRSRETAVKVRNVSRQHYGFPIHHPNELVMLRWAGRSQNVLSEWADDLADICSAICH